jgi:hypothetical protein
VLVQLSVSMRAHKRGGLLLASCRLDRWRLTPSSRRSVTELTPPFSALAA